MTEFICATRVSVRRFVSHSIGVFVLLSLTEPVFGQGLLEDFNSLGGNDVLLEKARALNPDASIRVVQQRIVNRRNRVEFAPEYSNVIGGDSYTNTHNIGLNFHYHISPRWSVGAKYNYSMNSLRPEGEHLIEDKASTGSAMVPDIDYPKQQMMALVSWYPIYGKMNLYDLGVAHFDVYALVGAGQIELKSGRTEAYTAGGGVGFWISQHLSTRLELRYQTYSAIRYEGETKMDTMVAGLQMGYLL